MHIVVLGAGALGVYYGTRLQEAGAKVTYVVRVGRAQQIKKHHVSISSPLGDIGNPQVDYTTDIEKVDAPDIILLGVKGYHLKEALPQIKHFTDKGAYVLPLLNGIEHVKTLQSYVGKKYVLGGLAFIIATLDEKGHVLHTSEFHKFVFGPLMKEQEFICEELYAFARKANIEAIYTSDVLYEMWKKYMYITAFSGITTALNEPIGILQENKATERTAYALLKEMQQLAQTYGIELKQKDIEETMENFLSLDARATSSMHQELRKGLRLEVDHLQGGAIRLANDKQVKVPTIQAIYGVISPFEYPKE